MNISLWAFLAQNNLGSALTRSLRLPGVYAYLRDQSGLRMIKKVRCTSLLAKISSTLQAVTSTEVNQAKSFTPLVVTVQDYF